MEIRKGKYSQSNKFGFIRILRLCVLEQQALNLLKCVAARLEKALKFKSRFSSIDDIEACSLEESYECAVTCVGIDGDFHDSLRVMLRDMKTNGRYPCNQIGMWPHANVSVSRKNTKKGFWFMSPLREYLITLKVLFAASSYLMFLISIDRQIRCWMSPHYRKYLYFETLVVMQCMQNPAVQYLTPHVLGEV